MKRFYKLIFINVLLVFIVFISLEFITYKSELKKIQRENSPAFNFIYPYYANTKANWINTYKKVEKNEIAGIETGFRKSQIPPAAKRKGTILLFGCSFTYGAWLDEFNTFSYKLQNYTNRLVLNRGFSGWGPAGMLYQLRLPNFKNSLCFNLKTNSCNLGNVEFVIYTFIADHVRRNYVKCAFFDDKFMFYKYDKKSNSLVEKSNLDNFYYHSYILRKLYFNKVLGLANEYNDDVKQFTLLHFTESNKLIKELFPNAQFIIFVYEGDNYIKPIQKELENNGISIIYLSNLSDIDFSQDKYKVDGQHPNGKAWNIIVPLLAKKLNL